MVGLAGLGDAHRVDHDHLGGPVLVHRRAALDDAPQRRLGGVGLGAALAPVDDRVRLLRRGRHHRFHGPAHHGHVQGVVPAPADGAGVHHVAGVAQQVREAAARPQVVRAVGALGRHERLGAVLVDEPLELLGDLLDGLVVGYLLPLVLAALARALERVVDALGMVMELDGALAPLAQAVAQHRTFVVVGPQLHQTARGRVHPREDAAVHVAHVAARAAPSDAVLVDVVVRHADHALGHGCPLSLLYLVDTRRREERFRKPSPYDALTLLEAPPDYMTRIRDIARVRRGVTAG